MISRRLPEAQWLPSLLSHPGEDSGIPVPESQPSGHAPWQDPLQSCLFIHSFILSFSKYSIKINFVLGAQKLKRKKTVSHDKLVAGAGWEQLR